MKWIATVFEMPSLKSLKIFKNKKKTLTYERTNENQQSNLKVQKNQQLSAESQNQPTNKEKS